MIEQELKMYNELLNRFKRLDSSDYATAYELSQLSLSLAERWNEIMLNSVKYSKELSYTKSEFTNYCYQKYKILMKIHDMCRCVWRQGEENARFYYNQGGI